MKLVFLGPLADQVGRAECTVAPAAPLDWSALIAQIAALAGDAAATAVTSPKVRVAVNGTVLETRESLRAARGDEVAFLPPVSGG